ncbi:hypothetical protein ACWDR1_22925 [Streptosporangium sandarakinum]
MAEYATHLAYRRHRAPDTIRRALSAIRTMHALAGHAKPDLTAARKVVAGYTDHLIRTGDAKTEPRRAAATDAPALRALLATCDRTTAVGRRDAALLLLGYKSGARESELVAVNIDHLTPHPKGLEVRLYRGRRQWSGHSLRRGFATAARSPPHRALASRGPRSDRGKSNEATSDLRCLHSGPSGPD